MHSEFYVVEEDQAKLINDTKAAWRPCDRSRNNKLPYSGVCNRRGWHFKGRKRLDRDLYLSGLLLQDDRRPDHQFPSAGVYTGDAGICTGWKRAYYGMLMKWQCRRNTDFSLLEMPCLFYKNNAKRIQNLEIKTRSLQLDVVASASGTLYGFRHCILRVFVIFVM